MIAIEYILENPTLVIGIISIAILIRQLNVNTRVNKYNIEQKLNKMYIDLLWKTAENPDLAKVWGTLSKERAERLEQEKKENHRYWFSLTDSEMIQYRYIRVALELLQQVYEARNVGVITNRSWKRWKIISRTWTESNFYKHVVSDTNDSFTSEFLDFLKNQKSSDSEKKWLPSDLKEPKD